VVESSSDVLGEVRRLLERNGMASLSELEKAIGVSRNRLSGFMAALEALGIFSCKGTRTYRIYMLAEKQ
jgi:DNA-binding IclR family transcriptional regulator